MNSYLISEYYEKKTTMKFDKENVSYEEQNINNNLKCSAYFTNKKIGRLFFLLRMGWFCTFT